LEKIILLGCGGHSYVVIDSIRSMSEYDIIGILDMPENIDKSVLGVKVIGTDDLLAKLFSSGVNKAFVCVGSIGNYTVRRRLYEKLMNIGFELPNIIDATAHVSDTVEFGKGVYVGKGACVNSEVFVDNMSIINTGSIIEHQSSIGEFTHISPGVTICGSTKIGSYTHIGAGSTIIQGRTIGDNTVIGAGSVVVKNIGSNQKAFGTPCKIVESNSKMDL
jgi:sugar O-acyltransferase (sialic acid O-acetyltransferase NeuD family)